MLFEDLEKHLGEAIGRIGGQTFGIGKMTDGIKSPEDIRRAVDQIEPGTIGHD